MKILPLTGSMVLQLSGSAAEMDQSLLKQIHNIPDAFDRIDIAEPRY